MRSNNILIAVFAILSVASVATAGTAAEPGTIATLSETSDKISSIDMDKNFGETGNILTNFYSGSKARGESGSSVVYAEPGNSQKTPGTTEKEICNAKPSKIILAGKVPPLHSSSGKTGSEEKGLPVGAGALAAGLITLGVAGRTKGRDYGDDLSTVWHAVTHPTETAHDFQAAHDYEQSQHTATPGAPNGVHPDHLPDDHACNSMDSSGHLNCD